MMKANGTQPVACPPFVSASCMRAVLLPWRCLLQLYLAVGAVWHLDCKLGAWSPAVCTCSVSGAAMGSAWAPCVFGPSVASPCEVQADMILTSLHWRCIRQFVAVAPSRDARRATAQHACESVTVS